MRRLFRSFEREGVEYLLISGQASILYGAATFSEDVDLWIRPTEGNARRVLRALTRCSSCVHKLTPPMTLRNMRRGHGFHFLLRDAGIPVYLDIMARPPRVGPFATAAKRALRMKSDWGVLPVVSIPDLIALKKTRRHADYDVISNLVALRVAGDSSPSREVLSWAARNTYRPEDRARYLRALGRKASVPALRRRIGAEIQRLQAKDASYWRAIVSDLRALRRRGQILAEGLPVRVLLSQTP